MAELALFIDAPTLSEATAVYTDAGLTTLATDGYYSDQNITRQQINGLLGSSISCPDCSGSTPAPVTTYTVTQNVTNNIVGTLNSDYILTGSGYDGGNPAGSVSQSGPVNDPYSFTINASPVSGKRFSSSNPFTATNPAGSIPIGGATVTNTLEGTIEAIPTNPGVRYYGLTGCADRDGSTPQSGFILRSSEPIAGQRYVATNVQPPETYIYDPLYPIPSIVKPEDQIENPSYAGKYTGTSGSRVLSEIAGETGCPLFNVVNSTIYQVRKCSDSTTNYYFRSQVAYADQSRVTPDTGSTIYIVMGQLDGTQLSGKSELINMLGVDINGVIESYPGYTSPALGCPVQDEYYILQLCNSQPRELAVSLQPATNSVFNGFGVGDVFLDMNGQCWELFQKTDQPGAFATSTRPAVELAFYLGSDCNACSTTIPGGTGGPNYAV